MVKISKEAALEYHESGRPGKIEVKPTKAYRTQTDLSLAYSPGVAYPCLEIQQNPDDAYKYTDKGNLVAVISNGTAVLGQSASVRCQTQFSRFGVLDRISGRVRLCQIFRADIELIAHVVSVLGLLAVFPGNGCQRVCFIVIQDFKTDLRAKLIHPCGFFKCGKSRPEQLHGLWFYAVFRHLNQPCKIIGTYPFQSLL